jgi:hypothetical protein
MRIVIIALTVFAAFSSPAEAHRKARPCLPGYDPLSVMGYQPFNLSSIRPWYFGPQVGLRSCPGPYCPWPGGLY